MPTIASGREIRGIQASQPELSKIDKLPKTQEKRPKKTVIATKIMPPPEGIGLAWALLALLGSSRKLLRRIGIMA
jgi:hypothetical protein